MPKVFELGFEQVILFDKFAGGLSLCICRGIPTFSTLAFEIWFLSSSWNGIRLVTASTLWFLTQNVDLVDKCTCGDAVIAVGIGAIDPFGTNTSPIASICKSHDAERNVMLTRGHYLGGPQPISCAMLEQVF